MGSCITLDLIDSSGTFQGGVISPGYKMRAKAMHSFTGKLPLLEKEELYTDSNRIGKSTRSCMQKGAFDGIRYELQGFIEEFSSIFDELTIIMTGGDHTFFESRIKAPIFVRPNLILKGLHTIFEHNER
jgi:type III pantothenate kinase